MSEAIPIRFEDEFPEAARILQLICGSRELRKAVRLIESRYPSSERFFRALWGIFGFGGGPITREAPKISRNALCSCGSGKKYKKCCLGG